MSNKIVLYKTRSKEIIDSCKISNFKEDSDVILYYTLNFIDYRIANNLCLIFIEQSSKEYKNLGIVCTGHLCRIYKKAPCLKIMRILEKHYSDKNNEYWGAIDDTLDDISIFLKIPKNNIFTSLIRNT